MEDVDLDRVRDQLLRGRAGAEFLAGSLGHRGQALQQALQGAARGLRDKGPATCANRFSQTWVSLASGGPCLGLVGLEGLCGPRDGPALCVPQDLASRAKSSDKPQAASHKRPREE